MIADESEKERTIPLIISFYFPPWTFPTRPRGTHSSSIFSKAGEIYPLYFSLVGRLRHIVVGYFEDCNTELYRSSSQRASILRIGVTSSNLNQTLTGPSPQPTRRADKLSFASSLPLSSHSRALCCSYSVFARSRFQLTGGPIH